MTPREQDPAVWAAAYGAAFAEQAEALHRSGVWGADITTLIDVTRCVTIADAAVRALEPVEMPATATERDRAWAALVNAIEAQWTPDLQGQHAMGVTAALDGLRSLGVDVDNLIDTAGR